MNWIKKINKYKLFLAILLFSIFIIINKQSSKITINQDGMSSISVFVQETCPHCRDLEKFLTDADIEKYNIKYFDLSEQKNLNTLVGLANKHDLPLNTVGTPIIFSKTSYYTGFTNTDEAKAEFKQFLENSLLNENKDNNTAGNNFINTIKYVFSSIFNIYSILFILSFLSLGLIFESDKKANILFSCLMFSTAFVSFLFLTDWLNAYLIAMFTRVIHIIFALTMLYYLICNYYYLYKDKKNIFNNGDNISKYMSSFVVIITFVFSTVNITRYTAIMNIDSIFYHLIYSFLLALMIGIILMFFYQLLKNKKNIMLLNTVLFLTCFYVLFLLKY